jgi:hypothetical protein
MIDPSSLIEGQEFRVSNERGTFVFKGVDSDGSVRCYGGTQGYGLWRNFRPDRITKVLKKKPERP